MEPGQKGASYFSIKFPFQELATYHILFITRWNQKHWHSNSIGILRRHICRMDNCCRLNIVTQLTRCLHAHSSTPAKSKDSKFAVPTMVRVLVVFNEPFEVTGHIIPRSIASHECLKLVI